MDFKSRYSKLNTAQKEAVDTIEGPLMVIAGPGTGKTELLSVRTANILQKTDTLPENILCLTFTDNGANEMRQRLSQIIGKDAYKVAIHTFHSFGSEIINQNNQYFYQGAEFRTADELSCREIINSIFDQLDYNSQISSKYNGEYTYLNDSIKIISELKQSGLVSEEIYKIIDANNAVYEKVEQLLSPIFESVSRMNKSIIPKLAQHIEAIRNYGDKNILSNITPISEVIVDSLQSAVQKSEKINKTTPVTAWKDKWFKKDENNKFVMRSRIEQTKFRSLVYIYNQYLTRMQEACLYDFDDMILRVVNAMEIYDELRFNLQEKYQYIMVDEFQDTNLAQMHILDNLTNNEVQGDTPNIMVVGDDDQAIYSFQGAEISNILNFKKNYPKVKIINLTDNYRSTSDVLKKSRMIISQGSERLENILENFNKELKSHTEDNKTGVFLYQANSSTDEKNWIAQSIKSRINDGEKPSDIAIFTRKHSEINKILPYIYDAGILVNYERHDNAIELPIIMYLEKLCLLLINISEGNQDVVNESLPEILSHKMWNIPPTNLWNLSLEAYKNRLGWMELLSQKTDDQFQPIYSWLINTSAQISETPLEQMLDIIIGSPNLHKTEDISFISPVYNYFFSDEIKNNSPDEYLTYLDALKTIRTKLRDYKPNNTPTLKTFTEYIRLNRQNKSTISIIKKSPNNKNSINIMTAHKSKGLEFKTVYIFNAIDTIWGEHARGNNRKIKYPENLPFAKVGDSQDERIRLFYVAMTRAKQNLNISFSLKNDDGKDTLVANFLSDETWAAKPIKSSNSIKDLIKIAELDWYQPLVEPIKSDMRDLILPKMNDYKLNVTHLHNFLDIKRGGPEMFFLQNILHFPQAKSPSASYGTAIHATLQQAHTHFTATGQKQAIRDIISNFESILKIQYLPKKDYEFYLQKGSDALLAYLEKNYDNFKTTEQTELNFYNQNSVIDEVKITGKLDLVDIDKSSKTLSVYDYKTGKSFAKWFGKTDDEKIKLHNFKQQLMFYKLLVENSRDWHNYTVTQAFLHFIEPSQSGNINELEVEFKDNDIKEFKKLLSAVWNHIVNLDLPDISKYEKTYKGRLAFEQDLIDNIK